MVLDEPTNALSRADVDKLFQSVKKMKENGKSIIFVTHKLDEIFRLTDRVTILRDGETIRTYEKKDYDEGKNLVDGVSFSLRKGECLGLVGLVGAGRTETVTAIFRGYPECSGTIHMNGREVKIKNPAQAISHDMNMLTEDRKENGLLLLNDIKFNIVISDLKKITKKGMILKKARKNKQMLL